MVRLVQLSHPQQGRRVALVDEPSLRLLEGCRSVYELAQAAMASAQSLADAAMDAAGEGLSYDEIYNGASPWRLLPPFDHPDEPARCLVTGTGLTHKASAENRQAMHVEPGASDAPLTDSMKMYRIGLEGGRPDPGKIGAAPEWFYKGSGSIVRAAGEALDVPPFADDGGEEAEIAAVYLIAPDGTPCRVGLTQGNEFSDHVMESKNYLYLAPSKLRACSLGPELLVGSGFDDVPGSVRITREERVVWEAAIATGERVMSHTLANLEHHHFKYDAHRRPGDVHLHFLGADRFSFRDRVRLEDGDVMELAFQGFGRALRNPLRIVRAVETAVAVKVL